MLKFIASLAVVVCSLSAAPAQETNDRETTLFDGLDANNDGHLTRDELNKTEDELRLFERFLTLYDINKDSRISRLEYLKAVEKKNSEKETDSPAKAANNAGQPAEPQPGPQQRGMDAEAIFSRLDNNQDGQLEMKELPGPLQERLGPTYKSLEKDALTVEEFVPAFQALFAQKRAQPSLLTPEEFFEKFDKNQDGKVTLEEVPEIVRPNLKRMFDQLNTEFITKDGYQQIYELLVERSQRENSEEQNGERRETVQGDEQSRPEFMRRPEGADFPPRGPNFFGLLDTDRDGKLSKSELSQAPQLVARLDRDEDDLLDPSEIFGPGPGRGNGGERFGPGRRGPGRADRADNRPDRPQRPALVEEPDKSQAPEATTETPKPETAPPSTTPTNIRNASNAEFVDVLFVQFDGDQDGKLSSKEAPARLRQSFDRLDLDADGAISKAELTKGLGGGSR